MSVFEMMLERDTANDQSALISAVFVPSGTPVIKDEPLFEVENSKATEEYVSPGNGILVHQLTAGQTVGFGIVIARISPPDEVMLHKTEPVPVPVVLVADATPVSALSPPLTSTPLLARQGGPRFSEAAKAMLTTHNLSASQFDKDFVTARDVVEHALCLKVVVKEELALPASAPIMPQRSGGSAVSPRKRAEIDALTHGAGATLLSVLGVHLGPLMVQRKAGDFLTGRITDLVLYEASRLMRKYPRLNAFYAEDQVFLHEAVHAGLAIDDGGRLMVYGLRNSDLTGLPDLADEMADGIARYVNGELTSQELTRSTFTVTDLSAGELDFVLPLLPRGQSCIVGITSSATAGYRLFAGFDHRVTEGREVMAFLGDLRERIQSFSSANRMMVSAAVCAFCARSATEAVKFSKDKGLLKLVGRNGEDVLCCGSCWNGW